jgi:hypothetical protein
MLFALDSELLCQIFFGGDFGMSVGVSRLRVECVAQGSITISADVYVMEWQMTSFFPLRRKLNGRTDAVYVAEKVVQLVWAVWLDDRISSTYLNQRLGFNAGVSSTLHSPRRTELRQRIHLTSWPLHTHGRNTGRRTENMLKSSVFRDLTPCRPLKSNRRFGGTFLISF